MSVGTDAGKSVSQSLVLATQILSPLAMVAAGAEGAGFDRLWTTEFQGRDAILRAMAAGMSTSRLLVGTGIAYGFTRLPRSLAAAALDAQELTQGRFTLGLGAGTRGLRRAFGADFEPPATRLAALIAELRSIWAEAVWARSVAPPIVAVAGVNEAMLRTAAQHGDRVLLHPLCLVEDHLRQRVLPSLAIGSGRRSTKPPGLSAWCITCVDEDGDVAREATRRQLAFYLSTPGYRAVVTQTPWEGNAAAIRDEFDSAEPPPWAQLARHIPDALLDQVAIAGTPKQARAQYATMQTRLSQLGVDEIVLQTVDTGADTDDVLDGIRLVIDTFARHAHPKGSS